MKISVYITLLLASTFLGMAVGYHVCAEQFYVAGMQAAAAQGREAQSQAIERARAGLPPFGDASCGVIFSREARQERKGKTQ